METNRSPDLPRITIQVLALAALIASSLWILQPFLVAFTWAAAIVVATWPVLLYVQAFLGERRGLAVAAMTIALILVLVIPLYFAVSTIVTSSKQISTWSETLVSLALPGPPAWIEGLPLVGPKIVERWHQVAVATPDEISAYVSPYGRQLVFWFVAQVGSVGLLLLQFLLTVIFAAILYANGEAAAHSIERIAHKLAGAQGENAMLLAGQAVRAVALGVVVTAVLQAMLGGAGLAVAGVPFAAILTAVMFILAVAQIGVIPVLLPATIWVYAKSGAIWGTAFLALSIFCGTFDNFLRPMLIKRGAHLPLLLIFAGVIGGLIAFGVIGIFLGPVVLAVAHTLLVEWVSQDTA